MYISLLRNCSIKALVALGNQIEDRLNYEQIALLIMRKLLKEERPMFYLVSRFNSSKGILKMAYANLIVYQMADNDYAFSEMVMQELLEYITLDFLAFYGVKSNNLDFRKCCMLEFWKRAEEVEDYSLLLEKKYEDTQSSKEYILHRKKSNLR